MNIKNAVVLLLLTVYGTTLCMKRRRDASANVPVRKLNLTMAQFFKNKIDKKLMHMHRELQKKKEPLKAPDIPSDLPLIIAQHVFLDNQQWWYHSKPLLNPHKSNIVYALSFYQDNKLLVSFQNKQIDIIHLAENTIEPFITTSSDVHSLALSNDEQMLGYGLEDGTIIIKPNINENQSIYCQHNTCSVWSLSFNHNKKLLAYGLENKTIHLLNLKTKKNTLFREVYNKPYGLSFHQNKNELAFIRNDHLATILTKNSFVTTSSKKFLRTFCLARNYNNTKLAIGLRTGELHFINPKNYRALMSTQINAEIYSLAFNKADNCVAIGLGNGALYLLKHYAHPTLSQLMLRKILSLWIQSKKQSKSIKSSTELLTDVANLFHLKFVELNETWGTFPEEMQLAIGTNMSRLIKKHGK